MKEYLAANGKIFTKDLHGDYVEKNGNVKLSEREMKQYEKYTGVKTEEMSSSVKSHPRWTELMVDHNRRNR